MSDQPAMESNISYYQRLLAMDQAEAEEIVEEHLKSHPAEQIYDDILVPALNSARRDRELGRLTEDGEQFVFLSHAGNTSMHLIIWRPRVLPQTLKQDCHRR